MPGRSRRVLRNSCLGRTSPLTPVQNTCKLAKLSKQIAPAGTRRAGFLLPAGRRPKALTAAIDHRHLRAANPCRRAGKPSNDDDCAGRPAPSARRFDSGARRLKVPAAGCRSPAKFLNRWTGGATAMASAKSITRKQRYAQDPEYRKKARAESRRDYELRRRYGISAADYAAMLARQGGRCAVCRRKPEPGRRLEVDHCHATDATRCWEWATTTRAACGRRSRIWRRPKAAPDRVSRRAGVLSLNQLWPFVS